MSARQEIHLGLVIDSGDVLVVQRKRLPEYDGMDSVARHLPGGVLTDSDRGPASTVHRNILAQTGFYTQVSERPILHWNQKEDCTHTATRYSLWTGVLADHARMPISDETIDNSGMIALQGLNPYAIGRIRMRFLRDILEGADVLKYAYS